MSLVDTDPGRAVEGMLTEVSDGIVCLDDALRIVLFNQTAARILRPEANMLLGSPFEQFLVEQDQVRFRAHVEGLAETSLASVSLQRPLRLAGVRPDGTTVPVDVTVTQTILESGRLFTLFVRDASDAVQAESTVHALQERIVADEAEVRDRASRLAVLHACSDYLQACVTEDEAVEAISRFGPRLAPAGGALSLWSASGRLVPRAAWGALATTAEFPGDGCWAVRRGEDLATGHGTDYQCAHLRAGQSAVCLPLSASAEPIGLLSLSDPADSPMDLGFARAVAAAVRLRLSNIQRLARLKAETSYEPGTGLTAPLAAAELLRAEVDRAARLARPYTITVLHWPALEALREAIGADVHAKSVRELARAVSDLAGSDSILFRLDEATVVVGQPGMAIDAAEALATRMRDSAAIRAPQAGRAAVGIAGSPTHGSTADALVESAATAARSGGPGSVSVAR
jgi:PAS domain S-box-containing protein